MFRFGNRHQWHHRGHGGFGPWGPPGGSRFHHGPGPFGGPFGGPRGRRRFGRGDLKFVVLDLLREQPRHGYDIIRALEERFHGFYSPSPGSVYPTLQMLEDQGYVTSSQQDSKRVYSITDEGRRFLDQEQDVLKDIRDRMATGWQSRSNPEVRQLVHEVRAIGQLLFREAGRGALNDPATVARLREAVTHARTEIESIFADDATPTTMV